MGKIYVVGLGPGNKENMTFRAYDVLKNSDIIIGYKTYVDLIEDMFPDKKIIKSYMKKEVARCEETLKLALEGNIISLISSNMTFRAYDVLKNSDIIIGYKTYVDLIEGMFPDKKIIKSYMKKEVARCEETLKLALEGNIISLISSGDAGVYGMAGLMLEIAGDQVEVEIVPGITSANASASLGGAPIVHDSVNISLSNLLTDWELIKKRIDLASQGDFVITLYNPKSSGRPELINEARDIMLKHKRKDTPVLIARNVGREGENYDITTLSEMLDYEINMFSTVIIGNSNTKVINNKIITPRGYKV